MLDVAFQLAPIAGEVADGFTQRVLAGDVGLCLLHPDLQLSQHRQAMLQAAQFAVIIVRVLQITLDAIELVDQVQRDICPAGLALGLYFLRINELTSFYQEAGSMGTTSYHCSHTKAAGRTLAHMMPALYAHNPFHVFRNFMMRMPVLIWPSRHDASVQVKEVMQAMQIEAQC